MLFASGEGRGGGGGKEQPKGQGKQGASMGDEWLENNAILFVFVFK